MKIASILNLILLCLMSCKPHIEKIEANKIIAVDSISSKADLQNFFPVTDYIKGQIFEIKNGGVNPMKFVTMNNHIDSAWLKMEKLPEEVADFLSPEIDTANLRSLFVEKKFMDQTLDAITLTYDPVKTLPDTFSLQHWDVYIDPNSERVRRIYLVKKLAPNKSQLLSWTSGQNCNIKNVVSDSNGVVLVEKEITIKWRF